MKIRITSKPPTSTLAYPYNSLGCRIYMHEYGVNFVIF
jgi:hypothetical protein